MKKAMHACGPGQSFQVKNVFMSGRKILLFLPNYRVFIYCRAAKRACISEKEQPLRALWWLEVQLSPGVQNEFFSDLGDNDTSVIP